MEITLNSIQCPVCDRIVYREHALSSGKVCDCGSLLFFTNDKPEVSLLPKFQQSAALKPGTSLEMSGKKYRVLGGVRITFGHEPFTWWLISQANEKMVLLGEGYGEYSIYTEVEDPQFTNPLSLMNFQRQIHSDRLKKNFLADSNSISGSIELCGEFWIPTAGLLTERITSLECNSTTGEILELLCDTSNERKGKWFEVDPKRFSFFNFENLAAQISPYKFNCTKCNHPIIVKPIPYAQSCICDNCYAGFIYNGKNFDYQVRYQKTKKPEILPGSIGELFGISFEVVGYCVKKDTTEGAEWREYTLYSAEHGFAFLSEYDGHWIYVREQRTRPVIDVDSNAIFEYADREYDLFNMYGFEIVGGSGAFAGDGLNPFGTRVKEFISPPRMWIFEWDRESVDCFSGDHISRKELETAFNVSLRTSNGVGMIQPSGELNSSEILRLGLFVLGVISLVGILLMFTHKEVNVFSERIDLSDTVKNYKLPTQRISLDKSTSNLAIKIDAPVSNSWVQADISLVNAVTGKEYELEQPVEYYYGVEGGESWSEGDRTETGYINSIPSGNYYLNISLSHPQSAYPSVTSLNIDVTNDTWQGRNFLFILLAVAIYPAIRLISTNNTEKMRWYNSPYSTYNYD